MKRFYIIISMLLTIACYSNVIAKEDSRAIAVKPKDNQVSEKRVALVIGNSKYKNSPLKNPVNDAKAISTKLRTLGFDVVYRTDITTQQIGSTIREFRSKLSPGSVALIFYAGHGIQIKGENYLPTIDANILGEEDIPYQSLSVKQLYNVLEESKTRLNIVLLDACRNNPYARSFRSATNGLAKVEAPSGTIISFATRPGSVAADGARKNGLYTEQLLKYIAEPNIPIEQVIKLVVSGVKKESNGQQEPWMEGSIEGDFFFSGGAKVASNYASSETPNAIKPSVSQQVEKTKTTTEQQDNSALDSPNFLDDLNNYINQAIVPSIELKRLADAGDKLGMARYCAVGVTDLYNIGIKPDDALPVCNKLVDEGFPIGFYLMGRAHFSGKGVTKSPEEAYKWYKKAAEAGNIEGMNFLASGYMFGIGISKDPVKGLELLQSAAEKGSIRALVGIAMAYKSGNGVPKDEKTALKYLWQAVEKGNANAMYIIGIDYQKGTGEIKKDIDEAYKWFRKAAANGDGGAMFNIGLAYFKGEGGVSKDLKEAYSWVLKSANKGNPGAMFYLWNMYKNGHGVIKDESEGRKWLEKSAEKGFPAAKKALESGASNEPRFQ